MILVRESKVMSKIKEWFGSLGLIFLIVFTIAMFSFKITGLTTKYTKYSHLIGAIIMLLIGILMIVNPKILMLNF